MINIIVSSDPRYPINKQVVHATVLEVLQRNRVTSSVEVGISVVGDRKMHEFNKKFRNVDSTTNILSFALQDPISTNQLQHISRVGFVRAPDNILRLGDILISYPQIVKDASAEGISIEEELRYLIEHGMKHLLGMHHD